MAERPQPPAGDGAGYPVPPQIPAPPDAAPVSPWSRGATGAPPPPPPPVGPPLAAPENPAAALWGPSAAPSEPDRWGAAPPGRHGTALLDRPTVRRPVVAPPVRPMPPGAASQSWSWERSHGLRNALLAAVAILLIGSLMAAFIVFRNRDDPRKALIEPPPATLPPDATLQPVVPGQDTVPSVPLLPPSVVPVPPATTSTTAPPPAPPTTVRAPTPAPTPAPTRPTPTVTASPPHPGCPPACPTSPTTRPRTTTTTTRPTPQ